ncbi:TadE/TadG family type IV pilus assembly protein [Micromonospora mirobrigensis]|uniref:Flp pilus assembly protein TadG n=1 Tax=Micromonospora mirobrigensis TaxID=262898 RepID=A0A1C4VKK7_9ACTN|nr:TadE/TadG family type IV pilus assembly protein [Micromonospora mirobrigensis]SCE84532.1 Flp pilus assembly protein TadG [Micromonospora mirobrigensis]
MDRAVTGRAERGSVSVEVAVLAPAFIALLVLAGVAGRTAIAQEAIGSAAHDAARAASISRTAGAAREAAGEAVSESLDWQRLNCEGAPQLSFSGSVGGVSTSFDAAFASGPGQVATVSVQVTCVISYADIQLSTTPGMPDGSTVSARFTSPLDRYRSRG